MQISGVPGFFPPPPTQQQKAQLFANADTDGDEALSLEEFTSIGANRTGSSAKTADSSKIEALFASADTDGDGKLTQAELDARLSKLASDTRSGLLRAQEDLFSKADTDGSGGVSLAEFSAARPDDAPALGSDQTQQIFSSLDTDEDGQLSPAELAAAKHGPRGHHGQGAGDALLSRPASSDGTGQDPVSSLRDELGTSQSDGSTTATVSAAALRQLTAYLEQLSTSRAAGAASQGICA